MGLRLTVVDSAAVTVVDRFPDEGYMQLVAREMSLSETAFVVPRDDDAHDLRWFTPTTEVDLCGHATLAAAHVLGGEARFHTRSGVLSCTAVGDGWIEMDFPADPPVPADITGVEPGIEGIRWAGRTRGDLFLELEDAAVVRSLQPDLGRLAAQGTRGVVVTAAGDRSGIDCVSRFFAPNVGIPEDPVTGSAHCALAVFWAARTGKADLVGEQASARGGLVRMRIREDRVVIGGQAVAVSEVRLLV
jgi:predicted PhzF superfamily epimerase YddE/YHI9